MLYKLQYSIQGRNKSINRVLAFSCTRLQEFPVLFSWTGALLCRQGRWRKCVWGDGGLYKACEVAPGRLQILLVTAAWNQLPILPMTGAMVTSPLKTSLFYSLAIFVSFGSSKGISFIQFRFIYRGSKFRVLYAFKTKRKSKWSPIGWRHWWFPCSSFFAPS